MDNKTNDLFVPEYENVTFENDDKCILIAPEKLFYCFSSVQLEKIIRKANSSITLAANLRNSATTISKNDEFNIIVIEISQYQNLCS